MATGHHVMVGDLRMHYLDWGSGSKRPIVLLPGGNLSAHSFEKVAERLCKTHRCLGLDHRGHGGSDWSDDLEYRVEHLADDLAGWLAAMSLNNVVLVGHSLGGLVALSHVAHHPEGIAGLVTLDIVPDVDVEGGRSLARSVGALPIELGLDHRRSFTSFDELVELARQRAPDRDPDVLLKRLAARTRVTAEGAVVWRNDPRRYRPEVHDGPAELARLSPLARLVRCPTLVIRGGASQILGDRQARSFVDDLPDGQMVVVPEAGHLIHEDAPDAVADAVLSFVHDLS